MAVAKYRENGQFFRLPITFVGGELEGEWKSEASYEALSEEDKMKPKNYYVQVDDEEEEDSIATSGQIAHGDTNVGAVLDSLNENLTKTDEAPLTLPSGVTQARANNKVQKHLCIVSGEVGWTSSSGISGASAMATIPAEYRPRESKRAIGLANFGNSYNHIPVSIQANGTIDLGGWTSQNITAFYCYFTYIQ